MCCVVKRERENIQLRGREARLRVTVARDVTVATVALAADTGRVRSMPLWPLKKT